MMIVVVVVLVHFFCGMKFEFLGKFWSCRSGEKEEEEWIIMAV